MTTIRLTVSDRHSISEKAADSKYFPIKEEIEAKETVLGKRLYEQVVSEKTRKMLSGIPKKWLCFSCNPLFGVDGNSSCIFRVNVPEPVPVLGHDHGILGLVNQADYEEWHVLRTHLHETHKERKLAIRQVGLMLGRVTTLNALKEMWPEGAEFYAFVQERANAKDVKLPALPMSEINTLLGLPKEK